MTNIEKIISKGYQIKKGGLFLGVPQNEEGVIDKLNPYMFYFIKPNGEFSEPHTFLDEIFYITDDKIPTTRREIIKYLYSPTEEEWCLFENGHSLRTKKYLDSIKNKISLIKIDGITEGKLEDIKNEEEIEPFTVDGRAFIGTNKDSLYVVQISYVTGVDSYYTDIYYFEKYPFRKNIETARKIREVESRFRIKELHETFICKECQQEQHWLNVEGSLETKTHYLSEKYCGC